MTLKKLVAAGLCLVIGVQVLAMLTPDRRFVLVIVGVAVALVLLALRWYLARGTGSRACRRRRSTTPKSRCAAGCLEPRR